MSLLSQSSLTVHEILAIAEDSPVLSNEEERVLATEMLTGNISAKTQLLYGQMRMIIKLSRASRECSRCNPFEDTLQEAIAFVWEVLPKYKLDSPARPSTYCYQSLRNHLRSWQVSSGDVIDIPAPAAKKQTTKARLAYLCIRDDSIFDQFAANEKEESEMPSEYLDALTQAIQQLDEKERLILRQYRFEGLSQEALAQYWNVSKSAIRQKIYRVMIKLRELFFDCLDQLNQRYSAFV